VAEAVLAESADGPRWRRDPEAKKLAIINAARQLFTENGYAPTSVRDIAAAAGVNQSLVFRYFGSKDQLYAKAVPQRAYIDAMFEDGQVTAVRNLIQTILDGSTGDAAPVVSLIRSARENDQLGRLHSEGFDQIVNTIAQSVDRPDAALVAELVLAWVVGIGVANDILRRPELLSGRPEQIASIVSEVVTALGIAPK
jgi:AcrR family transcriptional regulator